MTLAIFDLDNTLLSGDSDHGWGNFLVQKKLVNENSYREANEKFYEMYKQGNLDIYEYSAFSFKPLAERSMEELRLLHKEFMQDVIMPMIGSKAKSLVKFHRDQGHTLLVITATNSFITKPIVEAFGIEHLLATDPKIIKGRYTTQVDGTPCFHEGKVLRLNKWLEKMNISLDGCFFYSDSHNDLPLMELVETVVAVDPDEKLVEIARKRGWKIISLLD
ncbi:MAG TPA: HAD family hydrolase [Desulfobacterales bacterium]|nr:HAD family hydrolase [Desulfobacterales bacterium]HIP39518.1 HAD family hydrolase [Desulfocapsa sulfexigens]